ncbi:hypothetical protein LCGC14_2323070 [marine sediment metagenome]|uniref:Uncharacterized protein n=1 Tax=marine sediment metagenome TaxID=412755 RepID=A0A0F9D4S1_9ZZZZ
MCEQESILRTIEDALFKMNELLSDMQDDINKMEARIRQIRDEGTYEEGWP